MRIYHLDVRAMHEESREIRGIDLEARLREILRRTSKNVKKNGKKISLSR